MPPALAVRDLDGQLPDQPLAVTVRRDANGATLVRSALDVVAFAIGDRVIRHRLATRFEDEPFVLAETSDAAVRSFASPSASSRRDRTSRSSTRMGRQRRVRGPWLGLGRAAAMDLVTTCHLVVDGYEAEFRKSESMLTSLVNGPEGNTTSSALLGMTLFQKHRYAEARRAVELGVQARNVAALVVAALSDLAIGANARAYEEAKQAVNAADTAQTQIVAQAVLADTGDREGGVEIVLRSPFCARPCSFPL